MEVEGCAAREAPKNREKEAHETQSLLPTFAVGALVGCYDENYQLLN